MIEKLDRKIVTKAKASAKRSFKAKCGIEPHFYDTNAVEKLSLLVNASVLAERKVNINPALYTVFPKVQQNPTGKIGAGKQGIVRLDLMDFFLRASICNIKSCHSISQVEGHNYNTGQLGYINNPFWTCYGIFTNPDKPATLDLNSRGMFSDNDLSVPNLLATFNVALCYGIDGVPSALVSRPYGDRSCTYGLKNLIDYLSDVLGLDVYLSVRWAWFAGYGTLDTTYCMREVAKSSGIKNNYEANLKAVNLYTLPLKSLVTFEHGTRKALPYRYADIPKPLLRKAKVSITVMEKLAGVLVKKASGVSYFPAVSKDVIDQAVLFKNKTGLNDQASFNFVRGTFCDISGRYIRGSEGVLTESGLMVLKEVYKESTHGKAFFL